MRHSFTSIHKFCTVPKTYLGQSKAVRSAVSGLTLIFICEVRSRERPAPPRRRPIHLGVAPPVDRLGVLPVARRLRSARSTSRQTSWNGALMALKEEPKVAARSDGSRGNTWLLFHAVSWPPSYGPCVRLFIAMSDAVPTGNGHFLSHPRTNRAGRFAQADGTRWWLSHAVLTQSNALTLRPCTHHRLSRRPINSNIPGDACLVQSRPVPYYSDAYTLPP